MGKLIISLEIEERVQSGGLELMIQGITEQEGDLAPETERLGAVVHEQMRLAVIAAQTTMNERV